MKKEQVLLGLGLATAMATGFTNHVKADESINEKSSKVNATQVETKKAEVTESDVKNAEVKLNQVIDEEKNEILGQENILIYNVNIFVFIPT